MLAGACTVFDLERKNEQCFQFRKRRNKRRSELFLWKSKKEQTVVFLFCFVFPLSAENTFCRQWFGRVFLSTPNTTSKCFYALILSNIGPLGTADVRTEEISCETIRNTTITFW